MRLHIYAGLFTAIYLLAFGVSSLVINHRWNVDHTEITRTWESTVQPDTSLADQELAQALRNDLNIMGWTPWWKFQRDSISFRFEVTHLGNTHHVDVNLETGQASIGKAPKGFLAVFHGLHFLNGNIPNAGWLVRSWAFYQWLTITVMLASLVLGLWLWWKFSFKIWHVYVFGGLTVACILLMFTIA